MLRKIFRRRWRAINRGKDTYNIRMTLRAMALPKSTLARSTRESSRTVAPAAGWRPYEARASEPTLSWNQFRSLTSAPGVLSVNATVMVSALIFVCAASNPAYDFEVCRTSFSTTRVCRGWLDLWLRRKANRGLVDDVTANLYFLPMCDLSPPTPPTLVSG